MGKSALEWIETLQKSHELLEKSKSIKGNIEKVQKAAKLDPKNEKEMLKFVGLYSSEMEKVIKELDKRAEAARKTAEADYPDVEDESGGYMARWYDAIDKHGMEAKDTKSKRHGYYAQAKLFDGRLTQRIYHMDFVVDKCEQQVKIHESFFDYCDKLASKFRKLIKLPPNLRGSLDQATVLKYENYCIKVRGNCGNVVKQYKRVIDKAKKHQRVVKLIQKDNKARMSFAAKAETKVAAEKAQKNLESFAKSMGVSL